MAVLGILFSSKFQNLFFLPKSEAKTGLKLPQDMEVGSCTGECLKKIPYG